jgi:signal transduction histidine kinase
VKLWRGLGLRIVACSIACALLGVTVAFLLTRRTAREAIQFGFAPYIHRTFDGAELRRCEASPETWAITIGRGGRMDAYDPKSLESRNPAAAPLDPTLIQRLRAGEATPVHFQRLSSERGGAMLIRGAANGPCGLIQATWPPHSSEHRRTSDLLLLGALAVMALAAALGVTAVVLPLARRIDRLRTAAGRVGAPHGYASSADPARDELGELSLLLDQAHARIRADAREIEEREQALERHLADIAHDLAMPISSLQLGLEQAAARIDDPLTGELIKGSLKEVVYLAGLTTNLRLACQLRDGWNPASGALSVDLGEVTERVAARVSYFAKSRGIRLEVARPDEPVLAHCHPTAAEQVLTNLVENAVAYGDAGGQVAVLLEARGEHFELSVIDDGPGVLPTELPRLHERTFRSDAARQREPDGGGLGLAICNEVCTHCGWSLTFAREVPRGLRVSIRGGTRAGREQLAAQ